MVWSIAIVSELSTYYWCHSIPIQNIVSWSWRSILILSLN